MSLLRNGVARPPGARRWKTWVGVGCFVVAVSATVPLYETSHAERFRRLMRVHEAKAAECRRLERGARSAGRDAEAQLLARSARNFEWFAQVYRVQLARHRLTWLTLIIRPPGPDD